MLVPLVYLIVSVATVQASELAVTQAAREAGRAFATSDTQAQARARTEAAVRLALADENLADDATVRFVAVGSGCDGPDVEPLLQAGEEFAVCVSRHVDIPAVPSVLQGRAITTVGEYTVHVDDFRTFDG